MGSWYARSFSRKKTGPNFFVTETQWPWLGGISWWVTWILAGFLSLLQKRWVLRMVYEIPLWWKVTNGTVPLPCKSQTGGVFGKDFGGEEKSGAFLDLHDLEQKWQTNWLCDGRSVLYRNCWFDTLKIIHSVQMWKNTAYYGWQSKFGSPIDRSSKSRYLRWLTRKKCHFFRSLLHLLLWNNILLMEELHHHWKKITTLIKILR